MWMKQMERLATNYAKDTGNKYGLFFSSTLISVTKCYATTCTGILTMNGNLRRRKMLSFMRDFLKQLMLTEIRATNSSKKMQLMDELTEEYSPPEKLTVLTRRPKLSAFYGKVHHRAHITATRTELGQSQFTTLTSNFYLQYILLLYCHLCQVHPNGHFPARFSTQSTSPSHHSLTISVRAL